MGGSGMAMLVQWLILGVVLAVGAAFIGFLALAVFMACEPS